MFTLDAFIDTFQTGKKTFVNTVFANHQGIADALNGFVDAQTKYTKEAAKASSDFVLKLGEIAMDRTPYAEAQKNFEKFFPSTALATNKKAK